MAWPRTIRMNLLVVLLIVAAVAVLVQLAVAISGVVAWTLLAIMAVVAVTMVAVYGWHRRVLTARDVATSHGPSFGDVLRRRYASEVPKP